MLAGSALGYGVVTSAGISLASGEAVDGKTKKYKIENLKGTATHAKR